MPVPMRAPAAVPVAERLRQATLLEIGVEAGPVPGPRAAALARPVAEATLDWLSAHEVTAGDPDQPSVALTFDCENGSARAAGILDTLRQDAVRATFFLTSDFIHAWPDLLRELVADGHELGNHSASHADFTGLTDDERRSELTSLEADLGAALDALGLAAPRSGLRFVRFPYGAREEASLRVAAELGYQSAFWSVDAMGWRRGATAQAVSSFVLEHAGPGDIVIQHCHAQADAEALPAVLEGLRAKGLKPVTLSEVLRLEDRQAPVTHVPAESGPATATDHAPARR